MGVSNNLIVDVVNRKRIYERAAVVRKILFDLKCDRFDREFSLPFRKQLVEKRKKSCIVP